MPTNRQDPPPARIVLILSTLFLFGILYNALVSWLEDHHYDRGYTAILVIGGSAVTIAGAGRLAGWKAALWTLAAFATSGTPMTLGSIARHCQQARTAEMIYNHRALSAARRRDDETHRPLEAHR